MLETNERLKSANPFKNNINKTIKSYLNSNLDEKHISYNKQKNKMALFYIFANLFTVRFNRRQPVSHIYIHSVVINKPCLTKICSWKREGLLKGLGDPRGSWGTAAPGYSGSGVAKRSREGLIIRHFASQKIK